MNKLVIRVVFITLSISSTIVNAEYYECMIGIGYSGVAEYSMSVGIQANSQQDAESLAWAEYGSYVANTNGGYLIQNVNCYATGINDWNSSF